MVFEDAHSMWTETALTQEQVLYCHGRISGLGLLTNVVLMWTGVGCVQAVARLSAEASDGRRFAFTTAGFVVGRIQYRSGFGRQVLGRVSGRG